MVSEEIIKRIANGDESALAEFYDRTGGLIYGLLMRILGTAAGADEVMITVYQQVSEQAATYDPTHGKPMTWLITMAHHHAVARLRADRGGKPHPLLSQLVRSTVNAENPMPTVDLVERANPLRKFDLMIRAELSAVQQQVIELAYFSGLRQSEIAENLKLPLSTVKNVMVTAMNKMRESGFCDPMPVAIPDLYQTTTDKWDYLRV